MRLKFEDERFFEIQARVSDLALFGSSSQFSTSLLPEGRKKQRRPNARGRQDSKAKRMPSNSPFQEELRGGHHDFNLSHPRMLILVHRILSAA